MSRRIHDLSVDSLERLQGPCRDCVFWEVSGARAGPAPGGRTAKEAWWQAVQLEWGSPGKGAYVDDRLVGYATFGPAEQFPRAQRMGPVVSDDALLLAALWVHPDHRGQMLARLLLQSVLREAHRHGSKAVEAFGSRDEPLPWADGTAGCIIPEPFLLANGFTVLHEHMTQPLLRLDLRQTVRESVEHVVEGVLSVLGRRERAPAPARPALEVRASKPRVTSALGGPRRVLLRRRNC